MAETRTKAEHGAPAPWRRRPCGRPPARRLLSSGLLLVGLLTLVPVAAFGVSSLPALSLEPANGAPGDPVRVTVTGFDSCVPADDVSAVSLVTLAWDGATLGTLPVQGGKGSGSFAVPESQPAGFYEVVAECSTDTGLRDAAPFIVDAAVEPEVPVGPEDPVVPVEPEVPTALPTPVEPGAPVEPEVPNGPEVPAEPAVENGTPGLVSADGPVPRLLLGVAVLAAAAAAVAVAGRITRTSRSRAWVQDHVDARPDSVTLRDASMTPVDEQSDLTIGVRSRVDAGVHTFEETSP